MPNGVESTAGDVALNGLRCRYQRPSLDLFNEHCDMVVRKFELDACHVQGHAVQITVPESGGAEGSARPHGSAVTVRLADG